MKDICNVLQKNLLGPEADYAVSKTVSTNEYYNQEYNIEFEYYDTYFFM